MLRAVTKHLKSFTFEVAEYDRGGLVTKKQVGTVLGSVAPLTVGGRGLAV